jgi:hypothetical protein
MSDAFYKTTDPAVLAIRAAYEAKVMEVRDAGQEFANHFGGKMLARHDAQGYSFAGLCFQPAKLDPLWTKPDASYAGMQRPRSSLKGGNKEQRTALTELSDDWKARLPTVKADLAPVLTAIGTDWGNLFFCSFALFRHDGAIYVSTSAKLAPCMVEILASEYNAAKAAYESIKEAA